MAGSAPAQVLAIALVPLITATDYGIIPGMIATTAAMLCVAIAFNRLNLWRQDCGGPYKWVGRAVTPHVGFIVGWLLYATFAVTALIDVLSIGPAVLGLFGLNTSSQWGTVITATVLGAVVVGIAVIGIRPTARVNNAFAIAEYLVLTGFAVVAAIEIFITHKAGTFTPDSRFLKFSGGGSGSFAAGILVVIFWIAEWDAGIYESEETTARERNPGLAAILAVVLLGVMYTITAVLFACVAPEKQMNANSANALVFVANRLAGGGWTKLMALAVISSVLATVLATIVAGARISLSMARDQVFPSVFGKISPRFRTPVLGSLLIGTFSIVLVWPYVFVGSVSTALGDLIATIGILFAVYYAATGLTVAWLYRRRYRSSFRDLLLSGVLPVAAAGFLAWVTYKAIRANTATENWILVGILMAGFLLMAYAHFVKKAPILRTPLKAYRTPDDVLMASGSDSSSVSGSDQQ
jgi:amino acid transporter